VNGDILGDAFKGYVFKITGGSDKQGFAMIQGVLTSERVRLLLGEGHAGFQFHRRQKRKDTRKRKSVRGCITSVESALINMVIVKKGDKDIPGLTEEGAALPNRMGPKRAGKIRKLWNLEKKDDVRQYVIRRVIPKKEGSKRKKDRVIVPKIQRLVTPKKVARAARKERVRKVPQTKQKYLCWFA
jgi:small subunit ribosomal protein S6e